MAGKKTWSSKKNNFSCLVRVKKKFGCAMELVCGCFLKFVMATLLKWGRKFERTVKLCYKGDSYRLDKSLV